MDVPVLNEDAPIAINATVPEVVFQTITPTSVIGVRRDRDEVTAFTRRFSSSDPQSPPLILGTGNEVAARGDTVFVAGDLYLYVYDLLQRQEVKRVVTTVPAVELCAMAVTDHELVILQRSQVRVLHPETLQTMFQFRMEAFCLFFTTC